MVKKVNSERIPKLSNKPLFHFLAIIFSQRWFTEVSLGKYCHSIFVLSFVVVVVVDVNVFLTSSTTQQNLK